MQFNKEDIAQQPVLLFEIAVDGSACYVIILYYFI